MASEMLITSSRFPFNQLLYFGTLGIPIISIKLIYSVFQQSGSTQIIIELFDIFNFIYFFYIWMAGFICLQNIGRS